MTVTAGGEHTAERPWGHANSEIVGTAPPLLEAVRLARRVAPTNLPVLLVGETGTGKELLARLIHESTPRQGALVAVDCGALPADILESLLFGHRRGAFTGAIEDTRGLVSEADGGTLFLDELGSLPPQGQAKLLRVLETGLVRRLGDSHANPVGFRLVSTAQPGLSDLLDEGYFRQDLFQRIAGIVIRLPSLRERGSDIVHLARTFAARQGLRLSDGAAELLAGRDWPGNVRELRWTVSRCALFAESDTIDGRIVEAALLSGPTELGARRHTMPLPDQDSTLLAACRLHRGDAERIAQHLGIGLSTLYRRVRRTGATLGSFRHGPA